MKENEGITTSQTTTTTTKDKYEILNNITTIKDSCIHIMKHIDDLLLILRGNPGMEKWESILELFSLINVLLSKIKKNTNNTLKNYITVPHYTTHEDFEYIPLMLSTKLLPEQESENAKIIADFENPVLTQDGKLLDIKNSELQYLYDIKIKEIDERNEFLSNFLLYQTEIPESGLLSKDGDFRRRLSESLTRMKRKVSKIEAKRKDKTLDLTNESWEDEATESKFKDLLDSNLRINEENEPEKEIMKNIRFYLFAK